MVIYKILRVNLFGVLRNKKEKKNIGKINDKGKQTKQNKTKQKTNER